MLIIHEIKPLETIEFEFNPELICELFELIFGFILELLGFIFELLIFKLGFVIIKEE